MKIIGLTGYARSGKDSVGAVLVARGWHRVAFADNVRALAIAADPWIKYPMGHTERLSTLVSHAGWDYVKSNDTYGYEVRRLLQALGTGVRDVLGEQTWVDAALGALQGGTRDLFGHLKEPAAGVVVTDVRYPNEAAAVRARGGVVVRVHRPGVGPANGHATEVGVDDIAPDATLVNDGTLEVLGAQVDDLMFELSGGAEHGHR